MNTDKKTELASRKKFSPEIEAVLDSLRLLDDDFMTRVFDRNFPAAELLLRIILQKEDLQVKEIAVQKVEKSPVSKGRSITLDIFAVDSVGRNYDIEVQRSRQGAHIKRARFHSAVRDPRMLKATEDFSQIDESYVIFITEKDVIGRGQAIYPINRYFEDTMELFDDGNHIIFVNGAYKNDASPIGRLMHDFRCTSSVDMFYRELKEPVHYYKETEGGRAIVCEAIEVYGNNKLNEGLAEGRTEGKKEMAVGLYKKGFSVTTIAAAADVPADLIRQWLGLDPAQKRTQKRSSRDFMRLPREAQRKFLT